MLSGTHQTPLEGLFQRWRRNKEAQAQSCVAASELHTDRGPQGQSPERDRAQGGECVLLWAGDVGSSPWVPPGLTARPDEKTFEEQKLPPDSWKSKSESA